MRRLLIVATMLVAVTSSTLAQGVADYTVAQAGPPSGPDGDDACGGNEVQVVRASDKDGNVVLRVSGPIGLEKTVTATWFQADPGHLQISVNPISGDGITCARMRFTGGNKTSQAVAMRRGSAVVGSIEIVSQQVAGPAFSLEVCGQSMNVPRTAACGLRKLQEFAGGRIPVIAVSRIPKSLPAFFAISPGEPFGIAIRGGVPSYGLSGHTGGRTTPGNIRVTWGMAKTDLVREMGSPPQFQFGPYDPPMTCIPEVPTVETCLTSPAAPWAVDFGTVAATPMLRFKDGRFFGYAATFKVEGFSQVKEALVKRLGAPFSDSVGTVQNRMGATFEQETITWKLPHVAVTLTQRGTDVNTSLLTGAYLPIASTLPPAEEATAPM
jgi:hypothetical protein